MTYSEDEVLHTFAEADYHLLPAEEVSSITDINGPYLMPTNKSELVVVVTTDHEADEVWPDYVRLGGDEDSLTVRRANVVAISDGGLSASEKKRVRRAMELLPDRGAAVDVLEDR